MRKKGKENEELSDELKKSLKDIVKSCEDEDKEVRKSMIRQWKKNEEFWHGMQYLFWSEREDSWRSPLDIGWDEEDVDDVQEQLGSFSDKVVDIFKAHIEAIISALAAQIPSLRFIPDDADDSNDLVTARTYSKIADLVQRHNEAKMLFFRALFFLALQGLVASYRYKDSDPKYGTYKVSVYGEKDTEVIDYICPECGYRSDQDWSVADVPSPSSLPDQSTGTCPQCGSIDKPEESKSNQKIPFLMKEEERPKSRAKIDIFGPLHFKVSYYARNQDECQFLGLYADQGKDLVSSLYPEFVEDIEQERMESFDRFSRSGYVTEYDAEIEQRNLVTVKKFWLRPACFYRENDKEKRDQLIKKFPTGCKVILVGKKPIFISAEEEDLDDRWTIGQAGLSTYIHSDPICRPLIQIQEMRNQLVNLIIETISHGIPSDWADPDTVNFDMYGRFEAVPGYIYKAKAKRPGDPLGNSFYTSSRATLSKEVSMFLQQLDKDAQFCVGAFPSIYGGPSEGKSRTFAEYAASRQMALQRLSIVWSFVVKWWAKTIEGGVKLYKECVVEDERFVKFVSGNYINVWIRQAEMTGKVGGVEPESSESFPVSLGQKKEVILKLMELNNEYINSVIYNPENARIIQDCFAMTELKIPGEDQRVKQVGEINALLQSEPIDEAHSSVPIDPDIDDHQIHIVTIIAFAVDQVGLEEKRINPKGYANLIAHMKEHQMAVMLKTIQMGGGGTPAGAPPETNEGVKVE